MREDPEEFKAYEQEWGRKYLTRKAEKEMLGTEQEKYAEESGEQLVG